MSTTQITTKAPRVARTAEPIELAKRLTYKYNPGWQRLDDWHQLGDATLLPSRPAKWDSQGESYRVVQFLAVNAPGYRPANIQRALGGVFDAGCRCEHDCCGHVQTYTGRVRHAGGNIYAVTIHGSRNI